MVCSLLVVLTKNEKKKIIVNFSGLFSVIYMSRNMRILVCVYTWRGDKEGFGGVKCVGSACMFWDLNGGKG